MQPKCRQRAHTHIHIHSIIFIAHKYIHYTHTPKKKTVKHQHTHNPIVLYQRQKSLQLNIYALLRSSRVVDGAGDGGACRRICVTTLSTSWGVRAPISRRRKLDFHIYLRVKV